MDFWQLAVFLAYPLYLLLMAAVMRICGVPKEDVAKWVLHQAGRQRFLDLLRAARGLPDHKPDESEKPREVPG